MNQVLQHENPVVASEQITMIDGEVSVTDCSDADLPGLSLPQIIHWGGKQNESEGEDPSKGLNATVACNRGTGSGPLELCSPSNQHSWH